MKKDELVTLISLIIIACLWGVLITLFVKELQSEKDNNEVGISDKTEHESKNTVEVNGETYTVIEEDDKKEKEIIEVDGDAYIHIED